MSWVRWGSPCWGTWPVEYAVNAKCDPCPGSDVYVFESGDGYECCACRLFSADSNFRCQTEDEMVVHLREHVAAGHHVRPSLLLSAEELRVDEQAFRDEYAANPRKAVAKAMAKQREFDRMMNERMKAFWGALTRK